MHHTHTKAALRGASLRATTHPEAVLHRVLTATVRALIFVAGAMLLPPMADGAEAPLAPTEAAKPAPSAATTGAAGAITLGACASLTGADEENGIRHSCIRRQGTRQASALRPTDP